MTIICQFSHKDTCQTLRVTSWRVTNIHFDHKYVNIYVYERISIKTTHKCRFDLLHFNVFKNT